MNNALITLTSPNTLGVLAYIIIANKQIHSFQIHCLNEFLQKNDFGDNKEIIINIFSGMEGTVSWNQALSAFLSETLETQKKFYDMAYQLAYIDGIVDEEERALLKQLETKLGVSLEEIETIKNNAQQQAEKQRHTANTLFQQPVSTDTPKSLWQKIKNSKVVKAIKYIMRIKVTIEIPNALPEGRGEK